MLVAFEYAMMMRSRSWSFFLSLLISSFSLSVIDLSSLWAGLFGWCGTCTNNLLDSVLLLLDM